MLPYYYMSFTTKCADLQLKMIGVALGDCGKKRLQEAKNFLKELLLPARFTFVTIVKLGPNHELEAYMVRCHDIRVEDQIIEFRKQFSVAPSDRELVELYVATEGQAERMRKVGEFTITGATIRDTVTRRVVFKHKYC